MNEEWLTDVLLREFLLGKLADEDCERIEDLFLTDPQSKERVFVVEQDLIEEYIEDSLSKDDKERFLARYSQTEEQRRNLRVAKSIKEWALAQASASRPAPPRVAVRKRGWSNFLLRPAIGFPIAAIVLIAIVLGVIWRNRQAERRVHLDVEQELALLNSPESLRDIPPGMITRELSPVTVRSAEAQTEVNPGGDTRLVEVSLPWIQKERYATYQAEFRSLSDGTSFSIPNLQADNTGAYKIRLRLPTSMLRRGSYQIALRGIANDGTTSPTEEYNFAVSE